MNGKIKTKFAALFAVALMITVCVVPVVGNEDVQAITVPSDAETYDIEGYVYDATNVGITGVKVTVSAKFGNSTYFYEGVTVSGGKYTVPVKVTEGQIIDSVEITVDASTEEFVNGDSETPNPAYNLWSENPKLTITKVGADVTGCNFYAGYVTISGKIAYVNGSMEKAGVEVTLYEQISTPSSVQGEDPAITYSQTSYKATTGEDGTYVMYVPVNLTSTTTNFAQYCVGANIKSTSDVAYALLSSSNPVKEITGDISSVDIESDKYLMTVTVPKAEVTTSVTVSPTASSNINFTTVTASTSTQEDLEVDIEYTLKSSGSSSAIEVAISDSKNYGRAGNYIPVSDNITYNLDRYIEVDVKLKNSSDSNATTISIGSQVVKLSYLKAGATANTELDVTTDADGIAKYWYGADTINSVSAKTTFDGIEGIVNLTSTSGSGSYTGSILITDANYSLVTVKLNSESIKVTNNPLAIEDVVVDVTGSDIVGLTNGNNKYSGTTGDDGIVNFMVKNGSLITITPSSAYNYVQYASKQVLVDGDVQVTFTMKDQKIELSIVDYLGKPLSTVSVYERTFDDDGELVALNQSSVTIATYKSLEGIYEIVLPGNQDLSEYFVSFKDIGGTMYTFANGDDAPIALSKIKGDVKVIDVRMNVQILNADGKEITREVSGAITGISNVYVKEYSAYVKNGITEYGEVSGKSYSVVWDSEKEIYYFVGVVGNQTVTATPNNILAIVMPTVSPYIFDPIYPIVKNADTVIKSYRNSVSGTVYEADEKTVIESIGGATVSLYLNGATQNTNETPVTAKVKKDGTFTINTYGTITASSQVTIEATGYTFNAQKVLDDEKAVTSYYANETTFAVTFTDADGKAIEYTDAKINNKSVTDGKVILAPVEGTVFSFNNLAERTFKNFAEMTESMISSKKIDFISDQATYTVNVTDSNGNVWEKCNVGFVAYNVNDTQNYSTGFTFSSGNYEDGKNVLLMNVPTTGKLAVMLGNGTEYKDYFSATELYVFENYQVTVPAIGSFVEVTAAEANGTLLTSDVVTSANVFVKGESAYENYSADDNVVEYFAVDGKEYEFVVNDNSGDYSFGNTNVNGGKISAVDGLLLANEETVKGQVTFANGYNIVPALGINVLMKDGSEKTSVATITAGTNGSYTAILDVSEVVKYTATGSVSGESATPDIVLKESYFTGAAPKDAVMKVALYKGDDFVKSIPVTSDGEYRFAMDVSDGDRIVMTITANEKTFQQAIDLKAVQNDIIVPGTLVSDKTNALFADFYVIYGADTAVIGSKIVLSAKNAVSIQMDVANVAYTTLVFDGWYVNGEKVSDDVNATYTVNGPCEVYAYYTEKVTETGAVADSSNDLSMDVLILGIVIVVLALLAFVYAVKFKKE